MGKGLDHLQPLNDLLDLTVHVAQSALLGAVEFPAASTQGLEQHDGNGQQKGGDQKELPVDEEHHTHQADKHQHTGAQGDHALLQGHLHIVRVIGEPAHQLTVGMLVKPAQRQGLELVEQILSQSVDPSLGQTNHHSRLSIGGGTACRIDRHQDQHGLGQTGEIGAAGPDKVVDDGAHHIGSAQISGHGQHQKQQYHQQRQLASGEVPHQTADGAAHIFRLDISPSWGAVGSRHQPSTPSCWDR